MTKDTGESAMRASWLVQRLTRPRGVGILGPDNPFAFGGGRKNGGLSDEAMGLLRDIFGFDYMGAAEFEFGAVPEALNKLAKAKRLTTFSFSIPLKEVEADWRYDGPEPDGEGTVYVLCPKGAEAEVERRIRAWARKDGDYESGVRLQERTRLPSSLRPFHEWDGDVAGWLELDNGFMFFTDHSMWSQTAHLFGVEAKDSASREAPDA